jgi:phage gpG-like protein
MQVQVDKFGNWEKLLGDFNGLANRLQKALEKEVRSMAMLLVREIKKGIVSGAPGGQAFKELAESTKRRKGSSKPLIDTGFLVSKIVEIIKGDQAFVGLLYTARYADGESVANIGAVMEFGATITMPNGKVIIIPPRPFIGPVMKQHLPKIMNSLKKAVADVFASIGR